MRCLSRLPSIIPKSLEEQVMFRQGEFDFKFKGEVCKYNLVTFSYILTYLEIDEAVSLLEKTFLNLDLNGSIVIKECINMRKCGNYVDDI